MPYKATMLFQATTQPQGADPARTGGWSESVYYMGESLDALRDRLQTIMNRRAAMLPNNTVIVGHRIQPFGGSAQTIGQIMAGTAGLQQDIPQMAVIYYVPSTTTANRAKLTLRGLPDARVERGEYNPSVAFDAALRLYIRDLGLEGFSFKARDLTAEQRGVVGITVEGVLTTDANHTIPAQSWVRLLRVRNTVTRRAVKGRYFVTAVTANTLTLQGYSGGVASGGKVRRDVIIYPQFSQLGTRGRVVTRKVGAPFARYSGRASRRS